MTNDELKKNSRRREKMSDFICKKCGSTEYEIKDKPNGTGIAHGLYCAKCGFWHKWLGKEELKQYATKESKDEIIAKLQSENAALRERLDKAVELPFIVIDKKTGKEADEYEIALHEDWAKHLMYCDMEGFAIKQDGTLILLDECGKFVYCSSDRFEVVPEARLAELKGEKE